MVFIHKYMHMHVNVYTCTCVCMHVHVVGDAHNLVSLRVVNVPCFLFDFWLTQLMVSLRYSSQTLKLLVPDLLWHSHRA